MNYEWVMDDGLYAIVLPSEAVSLSLPKGGEMENSK
jgi:hypothetical protein